MTILNRIAAITAGLMALAAPAMAAPYWNGTFDDLPEGSYQRSCRDMSAFNGRLYARCQGAGGAFLDSEINFRACPRGRVENINGRLQCEGAYGGGPGSGGSGGGYGGSGGGYGGSGGPTGLIVYENPDYRGMRLEVSDTIPDLAYSGLDDQITSVRVLRGSWQICTGRDFTGQCWTLDADNPNLKALGANDKVSSIRRLSRPR
ncbi:MAG: beta/gamma crystallin-related protein [Caulobacter sp.]|nr:beta/gamma crystallin-related protein [Caulobacter sp.]